MPVVASFVGALDTSLFSFNFSFSLQVFSISSLVVFQFISYSVVIEFVCLPWSEVCSARVTSLI